MNPRIVGIAGPLQDTIFVLREGEVSIGRDVSNKVWSADPSLSRRHCSFIYARPRVILRDLGSRNGTRVNGMPVEEHELEHGDQISVGSSLLLFMQEEEGVATGRDQEAFDTTDVRTGVRSIFRKEEVLAQASKRAKALMGLAQTSQGASDLEALLQFAAAAGGIRDREALQWELLGFGFDLAGGERGAVLYLDAGGSVSSSAEWDRAKGPEFPVPVSAAVMEQVVKEREGVVVKDVSAEGLQRAGECDGPKAGSMLCVPLAVSERVLGIVYMESSSPGQFDENHLQILSAVADVAALALENLQHWEQLAQENQMLRAEIDLQHDMVGSSSSMRKVFEFIRRVARTDSTVLIEGESGTGKELVARAVHRNSPRASGAFVAINCAAIPESLLESELFGYEKGAFTGAASQKRGKAELADGGTLFLDEITEMAPGLQAKLLRVLQEREFERVGGTRTIPLDIRVIAATNQSLAGAAEAGTFRKDLFYRLNVVSVTLPPLRERREDIEDLAGHFIAKSARKCKTGPKTLSAEALACLKNYDWPGNVRELENAIERARVLGSGDTIRPEDLPETLVEASEPAEGSAKFHSAIREFKKQMISQAMQQGNGNYIEAAKLLGIHPNSLLRLMRNLKMKAEKPRGTAGSLP